MIFDMHQEKCRLYIISTNNIGFSERSSDILSSFACNVCSGKVRLFLRQEIGASEFRDLYSEWTMNPRAAFTALVLLSFTIPILLPVLAKELYRIVPFPLIATALSMTCSIPFATLFAWLANGCPRSIAWLVPPRGVIWYALVAALAHGLMVLSRNVGLFLSDWDFTILFRFAGVAGQGFLAWVFLSEDISWRSAAASIAVMTGIYLLTTKFEFSTARAHSVSQIVIQILGVVFDSVAHISFKKALNVIKTSHKEFNPISLLPFRYSVCLIPLYTIAFLFQGDAWASCLASFTPHAIQLFFFAAVVGPTSQVLLVSLANAFTVLANAICIQLRTIVALAIGRILYRTTPWTARQSFAFCLVAAGTFAFSASRRGPPAPTPIARDVDSLIDTDRIQFDTTASGDSL
jgi:hypothetical protein